MEEKYQWTAHSRYKLRQYALSESRIKRIIRYPQRVEEGVIPNGIAAMQVGTGKRKEEVWAMYLLAKRVNTKVETGNLKQQKQRQRQIRIITVWRYPGVSPERDPIPREVMEEAIRIVRS